MGPAAASNKGSFPKSASPPLRTKFQYYTDHQSWVRVVSNIILQIELTWVWYVLW